MVKNESKFAVSCDNRLLCKPGFARVCGVSLVIVRHGHQQVLFGLFVGLHEIVFFPDGLVNTDM